MGRRGLVPPKELGLGMLALAVLLWATTILYAQESPEEPPSQAAPEEPSHRSRAHGLLAVSLEEKYDDNIIQLSEEGLELLKTEPDTDRFLITTADDWVAVGKVSFRWTARPIRKRDTTVEPAVAGYRYSRNDVKDYEVFRLSVSQELTASSRHLSTIRAWASRVPDFYLRQITDDDASFDAGTRVRNALTYREDEYGVALGQEIVNGRLDARLGWVRDDRDYNHNYDERDSWDETWSLTGRLRPFRRWRMALAVTYEDGDLHARGDLPSTVITDDDVSYRHHDVSAELVLPWRTARRGRVELDVVRERRHFTTDNEFDTFHFMREDTRREIQGRLVQRLARRLDLVAEYRRVSRRGNFPEGFESNEDVTNYVEHRGSLGLAWSLRVRPSE